MKRSKLATAASVAGNGLEWYDFAVYGFMAPFLADVFFPTADPTNALIASFGAFAAGYLMRPIGGMVFGHFGDKIGRKKMLVLSVQLMAIPTFLVGCLPTYAAAGVLAPISLVLMRMLQGLSVGGELPGSVVYQVESAPANKRGLAGSWVNVGAMVGVLMGSAFAALLTNVLSKEQIIAWGWRLPFLMGIVIGFVAMFLRRHLPESESYEQVKKEGLIPQSPIKEAVRSHGKEMFLVSTFVLGYGVLYYLAFVYLPTYLSRVVHMPESISLDFNTATMLLATLLIPMVGALSDRIGRKKLLASSFILLAALGVPIFVALGQGSTLAVLGAEITLALLAAVPMGVIPAFIVETFPARTRYSAYSVSYNLTMGIFGGTTPMVATWLIAKTGNPHAPAFYLVGAALFAAAAVLMLQDRTGEDVD
jgi:MHS family proline/betaine transporter-like MFS transporter